MANKKVVICTSRPNEGAVGGAGGVVFMLQETIGSKVGDISFEYRFKDGKGSGASISCFAKAVKDKDTVYICHDVVSAFIMSLLNKKYALVYHQQGPLIEERQNLGLELSTLKKKKTNFYEGRAFKKANSVHFPSDGARDMYFNSEYRSAEREQVHLGKSMYNTIHVDIEENTGEGIPGVNEDSEAITFYSVGTLTDAKGQDQSINFLETLCALTPKKIRYIMVGKGVNEKKLLNALEGVKERNSNFEYLYFSRLEHSKIFELGRISDVYLMLHRISIFDLSTLEAMYMNNAVILSTIGGNLDFNKMDNVIFCDCTDYEAAARKFIESDLETLKEKNRKCFDEFFSSTAFRERYCSLAEKLLKQTRK